MSRNYMLRMLRREDRRDRRGRADLIRGTWPNHAPVETDVAVRVRPSLTATHEISSGGEQVALHLYDVRCDPAIDVRRGDVWTITRSADPALAGRHLTVEQVVSDEWVASRVTVCKEARSDG